MKTLMKDVQAVVKELKSLTKKAEKLSKRLNNLSKVTAPKKVKVKTKAKVKRRVKVPKKKIVAKKGIAKKSKRVPASDSVMTIINRSRKGIRTAELITKTGFKEKKIRDIIYRLKKQGKVKSLRTGLYVKI